MTRLNLALLAALIVSSLYLVKVSYESRRLFTELDRARTLALKLDTEHERLQIDRRAQATPLRVEKIAREKLQMRSATPAVTEYVETPALPDSAAAPAAAPQEPQR
jgi:cell division protein FtsL